MDHTAHLSAPEPATDEPGSSCHPPAEPRRFATAAEEAAYRAGLADACRDGDMAGLDFDPVATPLSP